MLQQPPPLRLSELPEDWEAETGAGKGKDRIVFEKKRWKKKTFKVLKLLKY